MLGAGAASHMRKLLAITIVAVGLGCAGCAASVEVVESDSRTDTRAGETMASQPTSAAESTVASNWCRDDGNYRARLIETDTATNEVLVEQRLEVNGDQLRSETAGAESGQVIFKNAQAWAFDSDGWQELPVLPVRPLRTQWVNNFVTGPAVARAAESSTPDTIDGFDVRRVALTFEQFRDAFSAKVDDSDYVPEETSFTYWLDSCDQIVKAEIITVFGPATADLMGPDFPLELSYTYESYDIGGTFDAVEPGEPIAPIPAPTDS